MNMFRAFMELDEAYNDRQFHIDELKKAGKNYNFSKYTDAQLYRMWQRLQQPRVAAKEPKHELDLDFEPEKDFDYCECGERLTDFGQCPVCDIGEEDLTEAVKYCWFGYYIDKTKNKKVIYATKDSTSYDPEEGAEMLEDRIPEPYIKFGFRGSIDNHTAEKEGWTLLEACFNNESLIEGNKYSKFANLIDIDILNKLNMALPKDLVIAPNTKCSTSATQNALFLVSKGEPVKFILGDVTADGNGGQIGHCWLEHRGEVLQTRNNMPKDGLTPRFSVDLIPNDVEASKKLIADLVNDINTGSIKEGLFDKPALNNWIPMTNKPNNSVQPSATVQTANVPTNGKYKVRIVSHGGRLRALATDGVHPAAFVAFPNNLRQFEGQLYEVDQLIWNGKNYRVVGNIVEI